MLQGLPVYHTDEMPTCALLNLSSVMPVAYSIACEAPCDFGCVIVAEVWLSSESLRVALRRGCADDKERLQII